MSESWNWDDPKTGSVVVKSVQAVAVYTNVNGDVVIRQQDSMGEEDSLIIVPKASITSLVAALKAEAKK